MLYSSFTDNGDYSYYIVRSTCTPSNGRFDFSFSAWKPTPNENESANHIEQR